MTWLRRRHGIAGSIFIVVAGLALAAATQTAVGGRPLAATAPASSVQGTDVSSLNGTSINWADVAGSERFVSVKATEGNYYTDPDYQGDVAAAAAAGLYVMPYVFANPYSGTARVRSRPTTPGRRSGPRPSPRPTSPAP